MRFATASRRTLRREAVFERLQADPPGADDQNALFAEISQCRLCQCECHGAGRGRVRADRRLRACAPRGRDRGAEEECESWADGAFRSRGFERGTDLSEDLGLAEHQRVKAGGHAAEVARDVFGSVHVEMVEQDVTLHAVLRRESVQKLIAGVLDTRGEPRVELDAITRLQNHVLRDGRAALRPRTKRSDACTERDGCSPMAEPQTDEPIHPLRTTLLGLGSSASVCGRALVPRRRRGTSREVTRWTTDLARGFQWHRI